MTTKLLYDASSIIRHGVREELAHRTERMIALLTFGIRGLPMNFFPTWVEDVSELPAWLLTPQHPKTGIVTWAYEPDARPVDWAHADRPVVVTHWPCYFRMPHWPESIFRLGTHHQDPPLLVPHLDEHLCDVQEVYYHEAHVAEMWDPFEFLKST